MDRKENYDYNACDELRCMDGVVFEYDLKGNMTRKIDPSEGVTQYAYDYQNRLFRITYPDKTQSRYYYNSSGLRTAKTDGIEPRPDGSPSGVGRTAYYYWDGTEIESIPNAINESDETGGITNTFWPEIGFKSINNGGSATGSSATAGGSSAGGSGFAGGGLGTAGGGQWRFFITDHLGSVIALTDESGSITDQYEYDEYGALIKAKGTSHNPYRYIGQSCDDTTGLLYLRARYYDPRTGRFVNRDPIGIFGGLNTYIYTMHNPINSLDLNGMLSGSFWKCDLHLNMTSEYLSTNNFMLLRLCFTCALECHGFNNRCDMLVEIKVSSSSPNIGPKSIKNSASGKTNSRIEAIIHYWPSLPPTYFLQTCIGKVFGAGVGFYKVLVEEYLEIRPDHHIIPSPN